MLRKPIVNTLVQIVGKAGMVILSLITTGVLTRKLGVANYGNFVLISSMFVLFDSLADFGTKTIGVREVSKGERRGVVSHLFGLRLIMGMAAFLLGLVVVNSWSKVAEIRTEMNLSLIMIGLTSIAGYWEIFFQSKLRMDLKILMDLSFPLVFVGWLWWWQGNITLLMVIAAYIAARIVSLAVGYWLVSGLVEIGLRWPEWREIKELWKITWPMGVFLLMFATYDRAIDAMMIQNFWGAREVAWYGLAYKIYGVCLQPAYFFANSIFPTMSSETGGKKKLFWESLGLMVAAAIGVVGVVEWLAPWMVMVVAGSEYLAAVKVLRVLIVAALFSYIGHLVGFTLISRGGQKDMLKLGAVALVINLSLNWILIPRFGILAAAGVTVLTEAVDCGLMIWFLKKKMVTGGL